MISLQKGKYLDRVAKMIGDGHIIASLSTYFGSARQDRMHYHENPHLSFLLNGGYGELRKNVKKQILPGGITFYYSCEYQQSAGTADSSRNINLELEPRFLREYNIDEHISDLAIARNPDARFFLLRTYRELMADDGLSLASIRMLLLDLMSQAGAYESKRVRFWIHRIDELLPDRWDARLTLQDLSAIADTHAVNASRQFHKYFSCTFGEFIRRLRIEKALTLIKRPAHSVTEIAHSCGFADQRYFTRTFKEFTGFLPHHYQKL